MSEALSEESAAISAIEAAFSNSPSASVIVFDLTSFTLLVDRSGPLAVLPWQDYPLPGGTTSLLGLFDADSRPEIIATQARAQLLALATTTVRNVAGQPRELTLLPFGPHTNLALALIDDCPTVPASEATPDSTTRTRITCDSNGIVLAANGPPGSFAGAEIELGKWAINLIATADADAYLSAVSSVLSGEPYASLQVSGDVPGVHFGITIARVFETVIIDLYDRSHHVAAHQALERSQAQFDQMSATLPVGVFVAGPEGRVNFASERLREMLGPSVATDFGWIDCIHPDDQQLISETFAALPEKRTFNVEIRVKHVDGRYVWSRWAGSDARNEHGALEYIVGFVEDISEWRDLNSKIAYQASFDGLTDLPNRITLVDQLRSRLEHQMPPKMTAVLFIDLDEFKLINDTQGHSVGDVVLLEVAQRFRRALRPRDLIGRFGGDEFVVVASDVADSTEAIAIGRRLHDVLSTPILADGRIIKVNTSIGIALSDVDSSSSEQLIGDADIAMYEAKASGRNRSVVFDATLRARASQRFDMTADLRHARRRRELRLDYQPIVDLRTNTIVGAEALVRWDHPAMGRIMPGVFIPLAEEIGLIDDVGEWVVEQACADLDRLRAHQLADHDFTISVNVSAHQFRNVAMLATSTLASLDQYGLQPSNLRFELTESVPITEIPEAARRIRQLTSYGFGLAIDDFGTGYSSLGYLTMLPFDVLKLDLSLVAQLEYGAPALAVVDSLTRMADQLGFSIVAEGIESRSQERLLSDAGVDLGQGYLISRPLALPNLIELLQTRG